MTAAGSTVRSRRKEAAVYIHPVAIPAGRRHRHQAVTPGALEALLLAEARIRFRIIWPEDLPAVAIDAMLAGLDSPSLIELASLDAPLARDVPLLERAIIELGSRPGSMEDAGRRVLLDVCGRIVSGAISPYDGACLLLSCWEEHRVPDFEMFASMAYQRDDIMYGSPEKEEYDREIAREAELVMRRHGSGPGSDP